jgi:hypothetical protein
MVVRNTAVEEYQCLNEALGIIVIGALCAWLSFPRELHNSCLAGAPTPWSILLRQSAESTRECPGGTCGLCLALGAESPLRLHLYRLFAVYPFHAILQPHSYSAVSAGVKGGSYSSSATCLPVVVMVPVS